jgi:hypothetical protein
LKAIQDIIIFDESVAYKEYLYPEEDCNNKGEILINTASKNENIANVVSQFKCLFNDNRVKELSKVNL